MDRFKIIKPLGDGTYGSVSLFINIENGEEVAIKKMKKRFASWDEVVKLPEVRSLRSMNHDNIGCLFSHK